MPTPILMPALSPTMEEGTLAKWLVKEGDEVNSGDIIAEIETDKATMEVEAVDEGKIGKILIADGTEGVKVNEPIAVLLEDGESASDIGDLSAAPAAPPIKQASKPNGTAPRPTQEGAAGGDDYGGLKTIQDGRVSASPLAKRLAHSAGIDLAHLNGTGPHGRVVKRDIEAAMETGVGTLGVRAGAAPAAFTAPAAGIDERLYPADSYEAIKNDGMRKTIAKRLSQSFNAEVPHFPLMVDCELDALLAARARINELSPAKGENGFFKISVNDFVIKASAMALMKVPAANATYTDEAILRHKHADIGIAVSIDGGLITPIVWQAETKGLQQISAEIKDMAGRAKAKKLKPEEYMGGTFSVSNLGMFGIKSFASIVNQPHGAILSVGAGEQRPVVKQGQLAVAMVMSVTLTCDHRVVDGTVGAEFIGAFKKFIEEPASMLL